MIRFTFFRLASPPVLHMDFARKQKEIALFALLINGDASNLKFKNIQVMNAAFKERIKLLDVLGERSYQIKHYLEEIPEGQRFLIISGHVEDELEYQSYLTELAKINGIKTIHSALDRIGNYLGNHYEVRVYKGDDSRKIGIYEKTNRVCRFCGRSIPEVHFKNKSHAISEALGNKGLICFEECDECNRRFNESIEQDITHLFAPHLLFHGVAGKKGTPAIKGDGILITNDTRSRIATGKDTIVYKFRDMPNSQEHREVARSISKSDYFLYSDYTPQNVYKCMCKYVLSLIDSSELPYFQNTIAWINEPMRNHKLPPIWHYSVNTEGKTWERTTVMIIMRRKHEEKNLPYCWAIFIVAGEPYLFIVPFCSKDKYKFVGKARQDFFMEQIKNMMKNIQFYPIKMSRTVPVRMKIRTTFEIPPDCVEGRDYYMITPEDSKEGKE